MLRNTFVDSAALCGHVERSARFQPLSIFGNQFSSPQDAIGCHWAHAFCEQERAEHSRGYLGEHMQSLVRRQQPATGSASTTAQDQKVGKIGQRCVASGAPGLGNGFTSPPSMCKRFLHMLIRRTMSSYQHDPGAALRSARREVGYRGRGPPPFPAPPPLQPQGQYWSWNPAAASAEALISPRSGLPAGHPLPLPPAL